MMKSSLTGSEHALSRGRNVVICCDGTGITENQTTGQYVTPSNIKKIFNCVDTEEEEENERAQVAYYERGVASVGNVLSRAGAGMTGFGIAQKIKIMYFWLGQTWQDHKGDEEDRLFLFGFSRGAFAVRSLMGMIYNVGLLDLRGLDSAEAMRRANIAFEQGYKRGRDKAKWAKGARVDGTWKNDPWPFFGDEHGRIPIHFIGVFDTVGQLGLPRETWCLWTCGILCFITSTKHHFHDVGFNPLVKYGRHAVAIDEMRSTFQPVFSRSTMKEISRAMDSKQDLKQVWFPGCHGNIGGGLLDCGLSDGALKWMVDEASKAGLRVRQTLVDQIKPDYKGNIYYTHETSVYKNLTHYPRCVPVIIEANTDDSVIESVHPSAFRRAHDPPISDAPYFDTKYLQVGEVQIVTLRADRIYNATSVYLEAGATYEMSAIGQWAGFRHRTCGPEGYSADMFKRPVAVTVAVGIGRCQRGWRVLTGNLEANLPFTRRHDHFPWYSVMGMIATGGTRNAISEAEFHTIVGVGKHVVYTVPPEKNGYFYCYANDAWGSYRKNKGTMELTIKRIK